MSCVFSIMNEYQNESNNNRKEVSFASLGVFEGTRADRPEGGGASLYPRGFWYQCEVHVRGWMIGSDRPVERFFG